MDLWRNVSQAWTLLVSKRKGMLTKTNMSRYENFLGSRLLTPKAFKLKGIAKKHTRQRTRLKLDMIIGSQKGNRGNQKF